MPFVAGPSLALAVAALVLGSATARADTPAPPSEPGLVSEQLAFATLASLGSSALGAWLTVTPAGAGGVVLLLASPVVPGLMVCALGRSSPHYTGGCLGPVLGAYLGALGVSIPAAFVGCALQDSLAKDDEYGCLAGVARRAADGTPPVALVLSRRPLRSTALPIPW